LEAGLGPSGEHERLLAGEHPLDDRRREVTSTGQDARKLEAPGQVETDDRTRLGEVQLLQFAEQAIEPAQRLPPSHIIVLSEGPHDGKLTSRGAALRGLEAPISALTVR
jgi:hypothetical protein